MTRPSAPAVITAGTILAYAGIALDLGVPWAAAGLAVLAAAAAALFWHVPLLDDAGEGGLMALVSATRECRCCGPEDSGPCTCAAPCTSIRCTARPTAAAIRAQRHPDFIKWEKELQR